MSGGERIAARARLLVGTRFRPQGRSVAEGLDCVGLVAASLGREGVRRDYALRGGCEAEVAAGLEEAGLRRVAEPEAGDVLLMRAGAGQLHLGVWTGSGLVHSDAALRRVVERPGAVPWVVVSSWRDCPSTTAFPPHAAPPHRED